MSDMSQTIEGAIMMHIAITHQKLESILVSDKFRSEFVQECKNFLAKPKSDYYCYGYIPLDAEYLEISMDQLKEIISHNVTSASTYITLNAIYQAGKITTQSSVYLYGRDRHE